jgi:hypothetical protein
MEVKSKQDLKKQKEDELELSKFADIAKQDIPEPFPKPQFEGGSGKHHKYNQSNHKQ